MVPLRTSGLRIMLSGLLGCYVGLAAAFYFGDSQRFSAAGFNTALDVLTRHQWAAVFAGGAITLAACWTHRLSLVTQLAAGMLLFLFWAACFALSALHNDTAGLTGPIVWSVIGIANAACASTVYGPLPPRRRP